MFLATYAGMSIQKKDLSDTGYALTHILNNHKLSTSSNSTMKRIRQEASLSAMTPAVMPAQRSPAPPAPPLSMPSNRPPPPPPPPPPPTSMSSSSSSSPKRTPPPPLPPPPTRTNQSPQGGHLIPASATTTTTTTAWAGKDDRR